MDGDIRSELGPGRAVANNKICHLTLTDEFIQACVLGLLSKLFQKPLSVEVVLLLEVVHVALGCVGGGWGAPRKEY